MSEKYLFIRARILVVSQGWGRVGLLRIPSFAWFTYSSAVMGWCFGAIICVNWTVGLWGGDFERHPLHTQFNYFGLYVLHCSVFKPFYFSFPFFHPQFKTHISRYYLSLCNMLLVDYKLELRSVLRRVFQRVGSTFLIYEANTESSWRIPPFQLLNWIKN